MGRPRASSVFPAPIRSVLRAQSYEEACAISLSVRGKKMSKQAYGILTRVQEADRVMAPAFQSWVVEVHPEVSFWALNGQRPLLEAKRTRAGKQERLLLLSQVYEDDLASVALLGGVGLDDFLDACVAAWTAARLARGEAERLPPDPPLDDRGLRMEMVY